jgi:ectoine hydroxylase-related dioxygenase (phytanoyl-CoA dioxygenase family)
MEPEEVDAIQSAYDRTWETMNPWVVVDDLVTNRRCRITSLSPEERRHNFKVIDLYVIEHELREAALSVRLGLILEELLGDEPVICNTLNFDKGSQQADHIDTLYMTPISDRGLVATWIALEDTVPGAGPLRYFPGSQDINPYRFSTGSLHQVNEEVPQWSDYMAAQIERRGLEEQRFMAKKGDVFIWHALLLHGGSKIENPGLTRQSLVTHYWRQSDVEDWDIRPAPGGWYIKKPGLNVPDEAQPKPIGAYGGHDPSEADLNVPAGAETAGKELHDRLSTLEFATD